MKKKIESQDIKVWKEFISDNSQLEDKDSKIIKKKFNKNIRVIDLHGQSLDKANDYLSTFIKESSEEGYKRLKIITGKGNRSNIEDNPFVSKELSILKNSVPFFLENNEIKKYIEKIHKNNEKGTRNTGYIVIDLKKIKE